MIKENCIIEKVKKEINFRNISDGNCKDCVFSRISGIGMMICKRPNVPVYIYVTSKHVCDYFERISGLGD